MKPKTAKPTDAVEDDRTRTKHQTSTTKLRHRAPNKQNTRKKSITNSKETTRHRGAETNKVKERRRTATPTGFWQWCGCEVQEHHLEHLKATSWKSGFGFGDQNTQIWFCFTRKRRERFLLFVKRSIYSKKTNN
jgi:hypothetical protein